MRVSRGARRRGGGVRRVDGAEEGRAPRPRPGSRPAVRPSAEAEGRRLQGARPQAPRPQLVLRAVLGRHQVGQDCGARYGARFVGR